MWSSGREYKISYALEKTLKAVERYKERNPHCKERVNIFLYLYMTGECEENKAVVRRAVFLTKWGACCRKYSG